MTTAAAGFQLLTDDHRMIAESVSTLFADLGAADSASRQRDGKRLSQANIEAGFVELGLIGAESDPFMTSAPVQTQIALSAGAACLAFPVLETLLGQMIGAELDFDPSGLAFSTRDGAGSTTVLAGEQLSGVVRRVPFASSARQLLVSTTSNGTTDFVLVPLEASHAELAVRRSVEPDYPLHDITLRHAPVTAVHFRRNTADAAGQFRNRANLLAAAEIAGACRAMITMTRDHLLNRTQFGRPLGINQALKHRIADAHVQTEALVSAVTYAAAACNAGSGEAESQVAAAKLFAGNAGKFVAEMAMQLHGAVGYTFELPLHLLMRRVHRLTSSFSTRDRLEAMLVDHFQGAMSQ